MFSENDHWFDNCFNAIDQFLGILDENGRVIKANHAALEYTGLSSSEMIHVPLWDISWPVLTRQNRVALKKAVNQAVQGVSRRSEIEIRRRRRPEMIFNITIKPIQNSPGQPALFIAEGRDITAYRRTSEALFQSEARFKTIFEEAGMGIVIKGLNGKMLDCNPAFQALVGYSAAELRRMDYLDITHPLDKKLSRKVFNELVAGKRDHYFIEKRYLQKNGQTIWARMTASLVREQDGSAKFVIGMAENITANKQIETELAELQQRLMQGRELERLRVAQDLHDGPLQEVIAVSYQVQELENSLSSAGDQDQLRTIRANLIQLTQSLRAICGELRPPTLAPFGLEKTIRSHAEQFQAVHPELSVSQSLARDGLMLPDHVRIVLFRIYQEALNNILRHAQAKSVKIRFSLTPRHAILSVQDDGVGFDLPSHWVRLARQGHLGLVGAMERAREVGGDFKVSSVPGKGTTIRVLVPLKAENSKNVEDKVKNESDQSLIGG
jgi:PAS domain S-box-containing protein